MTATVPHAGPRPETVLVTGGSGFIGRGLVPLLARDRKVRAPARAEIGEIGPRTDWSRMLDGADAVVHLAARVHVMRDSAADPLAAFCRVNSEGTARLADAAARAGVRRFVFLSTVKVHGEATSGSAVFTANDPPAPRDPYAVSKWEGEQAVHAATGAMTAVVLRPPLVYGPGVKGNFLALMRWIDRGRPLPLAHIDNRRSLIARANLCDAIRFALDGPAGTWLPSDGEDLSTPDLVRRLAAALGRRPRLLPVPAGLLRLAGGAVGRRGAVERLFGSLRVDGRIPGWSPPRSVAAELQATADWYRREGL